MLPAQGLWQRDCEARITPVAKTIVGSYEAFP